MKALALHLTQDSRSTKRQQAEIPPIPLSSWHAQPVSVLSGPVIQRKASCACGGGCPACQSKPAIQTKLSISAPGDLYEQEADRIADQVMRMPDPSLARSSTDSMPVRALSLQRQCATCEDEEELQRKPNSPYTETSGSGLDRVAATLRQGGRPLDLTTLVFMEPRFGADFSAVRIHTNSQAAESARSVNALAYTVGRDVVFNSGQYAPHSDSGKRLLAHELTHVVQQWRSGGSCVGQSNEKGLSPTYQPAPLIQRAEKINKEAVRLFNPKTQISAAEVALLAEKTLKVSGDYDLVVSSGSKDAAFTKIVEKIAIFVVGAFKESDFRSVLALDFSALDWAKAGVKDAATKKKFGSGLHAFELIRWDGGKKLQLRMSYLKEITEVSASDSAAKIKAGKTKFLSAAFAFKAPTAAQKKVGYKDWVASEQDIVYMAVSRVPDAMLSHAYVKGIEFYRVKNAGKFAAQYDQSQHRMEVGDATFEITEGAITTKLASPADLYRQSSAISGDAVSGFTSGTEYTIIHEISHALDWGPVRPELKELVSASERYNAAGGEMTRIANEHKKAKDDAEKKRLVALYAKAKGDQEKAEKDLAKVLKAFSTKTTLSGATFEETADKKVEETNPAPETGFEKAIASKTSSTPYAATDTGEAFAEGLTLYIINPDLLKEYRPDLYAYFKKLLP